jgi:hypothetical protein
LVNHYDDVAKKYYAKLFENHHLYKHPIKDDKNNSVKTPADSKDDKIIIREDELNRIATNAVSQGNYIDG